MKSILVLFTSFITSIQSFTATNMLSSSPIMIQLRLTIQEGKLEEFQKNQEILSKYMLDTFPGLIAYHADYPSESVCEFFEIYKDSKTFVDHVQDEKGYGLIGQVAGLCSDIQANCFGSPDETAQGIMGGMGMVVHENDGKTKKLLVWNPALLETSKQVLPILIKSTRSLENGVDGSGPEASRSTTLFKHLRIQDQRVEETKVVLVPSHGSLDDFLPNVGTARVWGLPSDTAPSSKNVKACSTGSGSAIVNPNVLKAPTVSE